MRRNDLESNAPEAPENPAVGPCRRGRGAAASFAVFALALFASGLASAQTTAEQRGPVSVGRVSADDGGQLSLRLGRHRRIEFERDVTRLAVADPTVASAELLDTQELLVTALAPGLTTVAVWFDDAEPVEWLVTVERDLTLLRETLAGIDPRIEVLFSPERDAVVLRGVVVDVATRDAAFEAASALMASGGRAAATGPLLVDDGEGGATAAPPTDGGPSRGGAGRRTGANVVNLLLVDQAPANMEARIGDAIAPLTDGRVTVRRIQASAIPDDSADVFLLEGEVADQVTLTRMLYIASRAINGGGAGNGNNEVRALADEAGALTQTRNIFGAGAGGGGGGGQQQGLQSANNAALGGGGGQQGVQLANRIGAQIGRAKVVEAADGRILSTVQVAYLPLVRVDVRLYEVNKNKLQSWRTQIGAAGSSFDQPGLSPAPESVGLQGDDALGVGDGDEQGLLGFLNGTLSGRGQAVNGGFAIDALFQVLVEEEIARSLSNPSLAVLSGELAQFQVGGQVPIPLAVTVGGGTDQVLNSVQFRDFGIDLTVRPLVEERSSSRITLDVVPRISLPDLALTAAIGSATGQPAAATAFESRATRTHARVIDGEPVVIGGLATQRSQSAQSRAPIVGSIPVLGWLFRNEADDAEETELVIIVTPTIVREPRVEASLWQYPTADEVLERCLREARGEAPAPPPRTTPAEGRGDESL